ncbi:DNA alkylation repair protein [Kitasatospora atroaurantiaca]|uniref:3-methyladenine DNA glycosylase AlkD n=1 Tax=Kitasatospora atroaurantiaca TaxID=285545 RepID=A0A561EIG7_9ACTN|nr:DNA alkylation repair protein [Kitasatospora atroaurantiaca]TWE15410.1 3-methyladenine DNA glycosylase AlkD [Kitasatospora atroaurantiaca]
MRTPPDRLTAAAARLTEELAALGSAERAEWDRTYLRSELGHLGVPVPALRTAVTAARRSLAPLSRQDTLALAALLWPDGVHDHRLAAVELLCQGADKLTPADLALVGRLVRESRTWALVDPLAVHAAGRIVLADPAACGPVLDGWAADQDFWIRRAALLALLPGIRTGSPDLERLDRYADALLEDREFFIRKATGWVLREISRSDPAFVRAWVEPRLTRISGVTLREAVRRLPEADRTALTEAYRRRPTAGH